MKELIMKIEGMTCGHCVGQVTRALTQLDGVEVTTVKVGEALMTYDEQQIAPIEIALAVQEAGYEARPVGRAA